MRPSWTDSADPLYSIRIHPALTSFADEVCAMVARLFAYVGTLALFTILAVHFWDQLPRLADEPVPTPSWVLADHSYPAFALSGLDHPDKSIAYTVLRHPEGGRKDVLIWPGTGDQAAAELEIYQLGEEAAAASTPADDLALRMPPGRELAAAGVIDSKFGTVALFWRAAPDVTGKRTASGCLGFFRSIDSPALRISGWSCQGSLPAQRSAVACMLDRLTLLSSGNEPKLAELFARAELKRQSCTAAGDWISDAGNPHLRGAL